MRTYKLAFTDFRFGLSSATSLIASAALILFSVGYLRLERE